MLAVFDYISSAGAIGWPIVGLSVVLWALLGYRWSLLNIPKGFRSEAPDRFALSASPSSFFELVLSEARERASNLSAGSLKAYDAKMSGLLQKTKAGSVLVNSIVAVAPLMGLLGTVAGMIITFRSMESMALFSQGGGIAGGISQALITTQMGLAVAIPGVLVGRHLAVKQRCFEQVVDHYRGLLEARLNQGGQSEV